MEMPDTLPHVAGSEVEHARHFMRERFHSEPEAASFIGGPAGLEAVLNYDEFARALRLSGYGRSAEPLFAHFARAAPDGAMRDGVSVKDLLRDCGLPREPVSSSGVYMLLAPDHGNVRGAPGMAASLGVGRPHDALGPGAVSPENRASGGEDGPLGASLAGGLGSWDAQDQLRELREEVAALRQRVRDGVPREALMEERNVRELGDSAMRQLNAKVEETLAREATALRADGADLRASLTEALRLLAEERKERQGHVAESQRRLRELQGWAEERLQRVEAMAKDGRQGSADIRAAVQEALQLGEMSEFRALGAVAEEARNREATVQREQQSREAVTAELENRWRRLLSDERMARSKEVDDSARQLSRVEDMLRADREVNAQRIADLGSRIDEALREIHEESNIRQAESMQLAGHREQLHAVIGDARSAARDDNEVVNKRCESIERTFQPLWDRLDKEVSLLKQYVSDFRQAAQAETSAREEAVSRLQGRLDNEVRSLEDASAKAAMAHESAVSQIEQHLKAILHDERCAREEGDSQLEQKLMTATQELNFERAKTSAQGRELAQALAQMRDALAGETTARRHELANVIKASEEACNAARECEVRRERLEDKLSEQLAALDASLREESLAREEAERRALDERSQTRSSLQREMSLREELGSRMERCFEEDRRLRDEMLEKMASAHDEEAGARIAKLEVLLQEEQQLREQLMAKLESRVGREEHALDAERADREERDKAVSVRLAELTTDAIDARDRVRECLARCEEMVILKEAMGRDRMERQSGEASLELAVKEQQVRLDQLHQAAESREKGVERRLGELHEKLEGEMRHRAAGDEEVGRQIHARKEELMAVIAAERRKIDDAIAENNEKIQSLAADERGQRAEAISAIERKWQQLREATDEAMKWRIEQYNELVLELSRVSEALTEEAKARQRDTTALENSLGRLHGEFDGEVRARKTSIGELREDIADALRRLEKSREAIVDQERQRGGDVEALRQELSKESNQQSTALEQLRQQVEREVLAREELMAGAGRSWKSNLAKTSEELRALSRTESVAREEAQLKIEQQVLELRGAVQEMRAMSDHREDEVAQRLKAAAEALSVEDQTRRAHETLTQRALDEVRRSITAEATAREGVVEQISGRIQNAEEMLHDEAAARDDLERRISKELLDARAALSEERSAREGGESKLEQLIETNTTNQQDALKHEAKNWADALAGLQGATQRGFATEQSSREELRRDYSNKLQQLRADLQLELEERTKLSRELTTSIARLQRLQAEEEENRGQDVERLSAAIEGLQEQARGLVANKEDTLQRCMEAIDQLRAALHKQAVARSTKEDALEGALREVRAGLGEEAQLRDASIRAVSDSLAEEKASRDAALQRERRMTEEELARSVQMQRKAREDEERRLQERLLEVTGAVSEERDQRQEALRQERQRLADLGEQIGRDQKAAQRELQKTTQTLQKVLEDEARRSKELDAQIAGLATRCEECRNNQQAECQKREGDVRVLEQRAVEVEAMLRAEIKERRDMCLELRKGLEAEAAVREDAVASERRARESSDVEVEDRAKAAVRDEKDSREAAVSQVAQDLIAMRAQLMDDLGKHEDERSKQHVEIQKLRTDVIELSGERKVDAQAAKDYIDQLRAEVVSVAAARKDDAERADAALAAMGARIDQCARSCREQTSSVEQLLQGVQSDLQREGDERTQAFRKLDARMGEERRFLDSALAVEARAREDVAKTAEEIVRQRLADEARKAKVTLDKVSSQIIALSEEVEKYRSTNPDQTREFAKGVANLQRQLSAEEQSRQQGLAALQRGIDLLREELLTEAKERRGQDASVLEEVALMQRSLQHRDDRGETQLQQFSAEVSELRERLSREARAREAALAQVEQQVATIRSMGDGSSGKVARRLHVAEPAAVSQPGAPAGGVPGERFRQLEDEIERTRLSVASLQGETYSLSKAMTGCEERCDAARAGISAVQASLADVQHRQKASFEVEQQILSNREELRKECAERRAEGAQLAAKIAEAAERLEWTEQQRVKVDNSLRQELMDAKATLKKEVRDREAVEQKVGALVREEAMRREEALDREARLRREGEEKTTEAFQAALREERRTREKEDLRIEDRSSAAVGAKGGAGGEQVGSLTLEQRGLRQALVDLQDRVAAAESRQKSAEERTVSMLDAIMSGLTGGPPVQDH